MEKNVTILYVDDEPINLQVFQLNFRKKYNVLLANSGEEGLVKLDGNTDIIVVISDMKMPGMNGVEFIRKAKELYLNIAYFILTGFDITDEINEALKDNTIQKYFRKPFDMQEISAAVSAAVSSL